ncbi:MAG: phage tail protein, partial [Gemmatimonadota bacterium]
MGGRYALVVDDAPLGFVKRVSGGTIKGEVAVYNLGPENVQKKHLATITYDPFTLEVGMGMSAGFYDWIRASFDKGHVSKTGEFIACDFDYKAMSAREFIDAHISEVTIPALDGSSKEPAYMTLKLDPERIRYKPGDGSVVQAKVAPPTKKWLCSNFRLELGDLPCSRVAKIDSFTLKLGVIKDEVGQFREATKHPAKVEVPNLKVTISQADIKPWQEWHKSFVIDGKCA